MASVLVLGGGVSGLSAGIYAQMEGFDVTICEKHFIVGGNLTGWTRNHYHIDNCVHWLVGTNPHAAEHKMWRDLGVLTDDIKVIQADSLYTVSNGGKTATLYRDLEKTKDELIEKFPLEKKEILRMYHAVLLAQGFLHTRGKNHDKMNNPWQIITELPTFLRYFNMNVDDLKKKVNSPGLKSFFSELMMSPHYTVLFLIITIAAFCADNGGLPEGGSLKMALRMEKRFKDLGGKVLTRKEAVKINMEGKKAVSVDFADGTQIKADYIIAAMDTQILFEQLLDVPMPNKLAKKYQDAKYKKFSSFHCAFACDTLEIPFEENYMFTVPTGYSSHMKDRHVTLREFRYCPEFAPEGHTVVQSMCYCSEDEGRMFVNLKDNKEEYEHTKQLIADDILAAIEGEFPELKGHLTLLDVWTPATYKRFLGSEAGSWMGFTLPPGQIPTMIDSMIGGTENVLISSQWLRSPGGLPTAATAGKNAAKVLKKVHRIRN